MPHVKHGEHVVSVIEVQFVLAYVEPETHWRQGLHTVLLTSVHGDPIVVVPASHVAQVAH